MGNFTQQFFDENKIVKVIISYSKRPSTVELEKLTASLKDIYQATEVLLEEQEKPDLIGGYRLQIGDKIFDNTLKSSFDSIEENLKNENTKKDIISVLQSDVDGFEASFSLKEGGHIIRIYDGIIAVEGMSKAVYGEIVLFENGQKGLVQSITENEILCILLGDDKELEEGQMVLRTKKRAGIPVGEAVLGRVMNPLGAAIDGGSRIEASDWYLIENNAPKVIDRQPVNESLETGILAIDSMFPIGKGQRELIIGDRQTGKTSIAVDTILNQKGKDVICIYVAIGQKASTIAQVVTSLKKHGAMAYCSIMAATASDPASLQYLAPYSGTSLAEYFMNQGKDVLIVYDDLSKHAVAYRSISLLLERSPGREAYPGDVFYLHSRLLERSSRMKDELGGGSITALPIVETQEGDVSAYIPTNVISITDGQIFLESDLFNAGNRPAVNVGLSVSRVGGAAQTKAMKKVSGTLRIDLAQYKEMESFSQFSSDLDKETKEQIHYGEQLIELLKQPLYHSKSLSRQVIILYLATNKLLSDIKQNEVSIFVDDFYEYLTMNHSELLNAIDQNKTLTGSIEKEIIDSLSNFKEEANYVKH